jgi:hypothetical protein
MNAMLEILLFGLAMILRQTRLVGLHSRHGSEYLAAPVAGRPDAASRRSRPRRRLSFESRRSHEVASYHPRKAPSGALVGANPPMSKE